ncbi:hypothetical protein Trco_000194 [Trichoderma cornu-damae]|uniref:Uncharacterized protein n=1 Tax=Trichoderma cornu-damae TaxID=654480 RepID=A0A9P8TYS9_9HYPO|nr:hypothetical protein Trco_000194 [Trichoderma cornu-damae]
MWMSNFFVSVLYDTDLGGSKNAAVELEALLLDEEDGVVFLVGLGGHEGGLVLVGVELGALGLQSLQAVLGKRLDEDALRHLEALVEVGEVLELLALLLDLELVCGDGGQGAVQVVDTVDEVLGELLDGKVAGGFDLTCGAVLEVAELSNSVGVAILLSLLGFSGFLSSRGLLGLRRLFRFAVPPADGRLEGSY